MPLLRAWEGFRESPVVKCWLCARTTAPSIHLPPQLICQCFMQVVASGTVPLAAAGSLQVMVVRLIVQVVTTQRHCQYLQTSSFHSACHPPACLMWLQAESS